MDKFDKQIWYRWADVEARWDAQRDETGAPEVAPAPSSMDPVGEQLDRLEEGVERGDALDPGPLEFDEMAGRDFMVFGGYHAAQGLASLIIPVGPVFDPPNPTPEKPALGGGGARVLENNSDAAVEEACHQLHLIAVGLIQLSGLTDTFGETTTWNLVSATNKERYRVVLRVALNTILAERLHHA